MAVIDVLRSQLASVQAMKAEIEAAHARAAKTKAYSSSHSTGPGRTFQDIGQLGGNYERLCSREIALQREIDQLEDNSGGSSVASFRGIAG